MRLPRRSSAGVRPVTGWAIAIVSALMIPLISVQGSAAESRPSASVPGVSAAELETSGAADREAALGEVDFARWGTNADWLDGDRSGVAVLPGQRTGIMMIRPVGTSDDVDVVGGPGTWEYATWTSPVTELPFDATELIASWGASTPGDSWISVEAQGTYDDGSTTPWYVLGNWDAHDNGIERASVDGQGDEHSRVLVDTFAIGDTDVVVGEDDGASSEPGPRDAETPADDEPGDRLLLSAYQLRVTMYRPQGSLVMPRVWMLGAMASSIPERFSVPPSDGGIASGEELNVPRRSKNVHRESHPEYGGGASWSNPAATTMVMEYFGAVPSRDDMAWIDAGYTDPQVAHAARMTWDNLLEGTGNWSFNTAYAATFPEVDAFVTRLRSLDDVERFIDAGIPVITSLAFRKSELDGAGYSTAGHSMVVVGFTEEGDVIVNDPAARSNASVRRVYDREQFEEVWLRTQRPLPGGGTGSGHGGIAQIIRPYDVALPGTEEGDSVAAW